MRRDCAAVGLLLAGITSMPAVALAQGDQDAVAVLIEQTRHERAAVRQKALEALARVDLADDGVVNRAAVIQAATAAISATETNDAVADEALRALQKVDPAQATTAMVDALVARVADGFGRAALVLGRIGARRAIQALETAATSSDRGLAEAARQALARLGDQRYLDEIVAELNAEGGRSAQRAFEKLAYVGSRASVRWIAPFLYHSEAPASEAGSWDRVGYPPYRHMAAWALGQIVQNPVARKDDMGLITEQDVEAWKAWWTANQDRY